MWWLAVIASLLGRPIWSIEQVYLEAERQDVPAFLAVAVVEWESGFWISMEKPAWGGSTDFGWWQFNSLWHDQHRESWWRRNVEGVKFLKRCLEINGGDYKRALSYYHRWTIDERGIEYSNTVYRIYLQIREAVWSHLQRSVEKKAASLPFYPGMRMGYPVPRKEPPLVESARQP